MKLNLKYTASKIDEIEHIIRQKHPTMNLVIHPEPISQNKRGRTKNKLIKQTKLPRT